MRQRTPAGQGGQGGRAGRPEGGQAPRGGLPRRKAWRNTGFDLLGPWTLARGDCPAKTSHQTSLSPIAWAPPFLVENALPDGVLVYSGQAGQANPAQTFYRIGDHVCITIVIYKHPILPYELLDQMACPACPDYMRMTTGTGFSARKGGAQANTQERRAGRPSRWTGRGSTDLSRIYVNHTRMPCWRVCPGPARPPPRA